MTTSNFLAEIRRSLSPKSAEFLDRLQKRPEVQEVLRADEQAQVAIRADLIRTATEAAARLDKPLAEATKRRALVAKRRRDHDELAKQIALDDLAAAVEALSFETQRSNVLGKAEQELRETADPRLAVAIAMLTDLRRGGINGQARHGVYVVPGSSKLEPWTNAQECTAAALALDLARAECVAMQLEALTAEAIEKRLHRMFGQLDLVLTPIELRAPRLQDGTVWTYPDSTDTTGLRFFYCGRSCKVCACSGAGLSKGLACGQADGPFIEP